jgi:hypothetical protein
MKNIGTFLVQSVCAYGWGKRGAASQLRQQYARVATPREDYPDNRERAAHAETPRLWQARDWRCCKGGAVRLGLAVEI